MYFFCHTPPITVQLRRVSAVVSYAYYYLTLLFMKLEFAASEEVSSPESLAISEQLIS